MSAWLKRFGLHLAAAVGATGIFVAAAAVGATQTRQQVVIVASPVTAPRTRTTAPRKPTVVVATPAPAVETQPVAPVADDGNGQTTAAPTVAPELPETAPPAAGPAPQQPGPGAPKPSGPNPPQSNPAPANPTDPDPANPAAANPPAARPTSRATPTARPSPSPVPAAAKVTPERSLAGSIKAVLPDGLDVVGVGGREWRVTPAPGALIRLNGKGARLDSLQAGDTVVILGQARSGPGNLFVAHAITARRK